MESCVVLTVSLREAKNLTQLIVSSLIEELKERETVV